MAPTAQWAARQIRQVLSGTLLIDTHEHMERNADGRYPGGDLFDLLRNTFYLWADLVSSGMPPEPWPPGETDDEVRWDVLRRHLPHVENSAYYRGIMRGLQDIHGMDGPVLTDANWRPLNRAIRAAYTDPCWPEKVLRERVHIEWIINDVDGFNMNPRLFLPAIKFDYLLRGGTVEGRAFIQSTHGTPVETFRDYVALLDRVVDEFRSRGARALKTVTPYYRGFDYEPVAEEDAGRAFAAPDPSAPERRKLVEDFAFHRIVSEAARLGLPVQIHTGLLAWNTINLPHCNPAALNPLFIRYPSCRFILFHGGYPFADELGVLVKTFPNVYLDLCWLPWISPVLARRYLDIWLDLVPANKFMWGGDAHRAECVHGHWLQAQDVVAEVLGERVARGDFSEALASRIATNIFRDNALTLFQLAAGAQ